MLMVILCAENYNLEVNLNDKTKIKPSCRTRFGIYPAHCLFHRLKNLKRDENKYLRFLKLLKSQLALVIS